jgi:hypothetical protein
MDDVAEHIPLEIGPDLLVSIEHELDHLTAYFVLCITYHLFVSYLLKS